MKPLLLAILILLLSQFSLSQQTDKPIEKNHQFGFIEGVNYPQKFGRAGITIGLLYEYEPHNMLAVGINSNLSFVERRINDNIIESTNLEFPIYAAFEPFNGKVRPQLGAGLEPNFELQGISRINGIFILGLELQLLYFTIAPRFRYSYGRNNDMLYFSLIFKG
ncbi:hypothetical protein K6119_08145 [Paracrocinitomix mangrovi]|uniref:hypothetical protein n=1 Tax=Paracrocinitomix mangrovi TaxID=2862509 RepID=UPI001C8E66F8|nr:hypothetical protein [Paracrocinitomix mangrovi]UKN03483.1 hypothetical protein K6119_08145 [Paracrocinitomix mangrovi]